MECHEVIGVFLEHLALGLGLVPLGPEHQLAGEALFLRGGLGLGIGGGIGLSLG